MKKIFTGKVENGKLRLYDRQSFNLAVYTLNNKEVEVTISKKRKKRTLPENKYYWGVIINILSDFTGYTDTEMHDALRMMFLKYRGEKIETIKSTTELSTVEFEEYMSKIREWASLELDLYIPMPNEVEYDV